jgi:hypothetical protein
MPGTPIIFLDIDGVLNSHAYLQRAPGAFDDRDPAKMIDDQAVAHLNAIVERSGADVVISSSWRIAHRLPTIRDALRRRGFVGRVIGRTPIGHREPIRGVIRGCVRGNEIQGWLDAAAQRQGFSVSSFVILDDNSDMGHLLPRLVQTTYGHGLLPAHVAKALAVLEERYAP